MLFEDMKNILVGLCVLVCACGDDDGGPPDAGVPDAAPDAPPVAAGKCGGQPACGSISVQELSVQGIPELGQGIQISIDLDSESYKLPTIQGALIGGCSATEYTPAELAAEPGLDEGTVQITHLPQTGSAMVFPPCSFVAGAGYLCVHESSTGNLIVNDDAGGPDTAALIQTDSTSFNVAEVGSVISVTGFANAGNNGTFPIVAVPAPGTLIIANPGAASEAGASATFTVIVGQGPVPGVSDPGFIGDDDGLTVQLIPGDQGDLPAFTATFAAGAGQGVGDDFTLDTASQALLTALPDSSTFSVSCSGEGGTCNTAIGSILTITTTDADITGLPPYVMPAATSKQVLVTCTTLSAEGTLQVTEDIAALLAASRPTRARSTYLRSNLATQAGGLVNVIAGHGVVGFTTY